MSEACFASDSSGTRTQYSNENYTIKGHSQLWDCADLAGQSFSHFGKSSPQPGIKVYLEFRLNFRSVLLDFQSFIEKPVFESPFGSSYDIINISG